MLFSAVLVSAIAAVPQVQSLPKDSVFSVNGLTRSVSNTGSLYATDCGRTTFVSPWQNSFPTIKVQNQIITLRIKKSAKNAKDSMNFQSKIMKTRRGVTNFPDFASTEPTNISKMVNYPAKADETLLAVDVAKFLGSDTSSFAWVQVVGYGGADGKTALEKQCFPIYLIKQ